MDSKSMEDSSGSTEKDSSWATKKAADPTAAKNAGAAITVATSEGEEGHNGVQKCVGLDGMQEREGPTTTASGSTSTAGPTMSTTPTPAS